MNLIYGAPEPEIQLIQGCLKNDRKFQRALYDKYKNSMYTLACRILKDKHKAEDALQDTFIAVFNKLSDFKLQSTLGAWIRTILVRTALTYLQKPSFVQPLEPEIHDYPIAWDETLSGNALHEAIQQLSEGYRLVFILSEVEGYSHKEIGEELGISEGTSKSQLFHAKKILQKKLRELNPNLN